MLCRFKGKSRSKITDKLREEIIQVIKCIKNLYNSKVIPHGVDDNRCKYCSIKNICLPIERRILKEKSK
ncbi:Dna2/Cas4 domain-containing protein (plasmid) [Clostridium botulinum]|nr:Dna2/Cas4 domain-containing protein [Clostridium botulinum]